MVYELRHLVEGIHGGAARLTHAMLEVELSWVIKDEYSLGLWVIKVRPDHRGLPP